MSWSMESTLDAEGVDPTMVFARYTDASSWHRWGHNTSWARARTAVEPGATVDVRAHRYPWTYGVRILEVDPGRLVVCEVRPIGVRIVSTYEVTPVDGGARLRHEIAVSGPLELGYRLLRPQYTRLLAREVRALADLARQASDPAGRAAAP